MTELARRPLAWLTLLATPFLAAQVFAFSLDGNLRGWVALTAGFVGLLVLVALGGGLRIDFASFIPVVATYCLASAVLFASMADRGEVGALEFRLGVTLGVLLLFIFVGFPTFVLGRLTGACIRSPNRRLPH